MSPLGRPPSDLRGFPTHRLDPGTDLFRIHRHRRASWWFSSEGLGRFDLGEPRGTCYLATDPLGAFVEVFRYASRISQSDLDGRRLSRLRVPRDVLLADCTHSRARGFGLTAAIHASPDYSLTQVWAAAFREARHEGIRYLLSHDPSQRLVGVALFGSAGSADWPVVSTAPIGTDLLEAALTRFGLLVLPTA